MGYSRVVPRRFSARQNPDEVKRYLNFYRIIEGGPVPFWFFDETGVQANCKLKKVITQKGSKPKVPYTGEHIAKM